MGLKQNELNRISKNRLTSKIGYNELPVNPASIKQVLLAGATLLDSVHMPNSGIKVGQDLVHKIRIQNNIFEQGAGLINLTASLDVGLG